jgi:hypothetical protein
MMTESKAFYDEFDEIDDLESDQETDITQETATHP